MGIADKLRRDDEAAERSQTIRRLVMAVVALAVFLFVFFYFLLPMWRGTPQP